MALYASVQRVKDALGIADSIDDSKVLTACEAASEMVDDYCGRSFTSGTATRYYAADDEDELYVDDLASSSITLLTKSTPLGSYDIAWATTDYQLEPVNGLRAGVTVPYTCIRAINRYAFTESDILTVSVTGTFGWPAIPARVTQAATYLAEALYKRNDSPLGVAGLQEFGVMRVSRYIDPHVEQLLSRYRRGGDVAGGIA